MQVNTCSSLPKANLVEILCTGNLSRTADFDYVLISPINSTISIFESIISVPVLTKKKTYMVTILITYLRLE